MKSFELYHVVMQPSPEIERSVSRSIYESLEHRKFLANDIQPYLEATSEVNRYLADECISMHSEWGAVLK